MGKFRAKEIVYDDNSKEYIIQQRRLFGLFWEVLEIRECNRNEFKNEIVISMDNDEIKNFIVNDEITAMHCLKWLSLDKENICFKNKDKHLLFGFPLNEFCHTYIVSTSLSEIIRKKQEINISFIKLKKNINEKHILKYNKKLNEFYKN